MIKVSTEKKRTENFCNNALRALMQFFVLFWLIPRSTAKYLIHFLNHVIYHQFVESNFVRFCGYMEECLFSNEFRCTPVSVWTPRKNEFARNKIANTVHSSIKNFWSYQIRTLLKIYIFVVFFWKFYNICMQWDIQCTHYGSHVFYN